MRLEEFDMRSSSLQWYLFVLSLLSLDFVFDFIRLSNDLGSDLLLEDFLEDLGSAP